MQGLHPDSQGGGGYPYTFLFEAVAVEGPKRDNHLGGPSSVEIGLNVKEFTESWYFIYVYGKQNHYLFS